MYTRELRVHFSTGHVMIERCRYLVKPPRLHLGTINLQGISKIPLRKLNPEKLGAKSIGVNLNFRQTLLTGASEWTDDGWLATFAYYCRKQPKTDSNKFGLQNVQTNASLN